MIGITMHHVKEYEIKNEYILAKSKLKPAKTFICICQLRFLMCIAHMDPVRLPRQVINSQATMQGKCSGNVASTKRVLYKMALEKVGLFEKGNSMKITTNLWIESRTDARIIQKRKEGERRRNT